MKKKTAFILFFLSTQVSVSLALQEPIGPKLLEVAAKQRGPERTVLEAIAEILSDLAIADREQERSFRVFGREDESDALLDVLVRLKGAVPVLTGDAGVGKTTTVVRAVQKSLLKKYPKEAAFKKVLGDSVWISTSPGRLMKLANGSSPAEKMAAIELFCDSVLELEKKYGTRFIVFIDEIHNLDRHQVEALLPYLDSRDKGIHLVGATNSNKFQLAFKENDAFLRRIQQVPVEEMSEKATLEVLKQWWVENIENNYGVKFDEEAIKATVRVGPTLLPEAGRFDASIKTLQDVAIRTVRHRRDETDAPLQIDSASIYDFLTMRTGYPVNPFDSRAVLEFIEGLREGLSDEIIDQPRMVNDVLRLFQSVMIGSKKGVGVSLLVGPTGTGKSELGIALARLGFKNPDAFLRIDANEYKSGPHTFSKLFGAEGGLVTSNTRSGILCDFFDDPAKGKYGGVILIDEGERACPEFWERLMEFFDTGSFVGGDGRRRYSRKHLVIVTSNRGDKILFPERAVHWTDDELNSRVADITPREIKDLFLQKISGKDEFSLPVPVLNRVDVYSAARPISKGTATRIVAKTLRDFARETKTHFDLNMEMGEELVRYLSQLEFNLRDGARPIITRTLQIVQDARTQALAHMGLLPNESLRFDLAGEDAHRKSLKLTSGDRERTIELPEARVEDPLKDPATRDRLRNLEPRIQQRVIGQDQAVSSVSQATIAHVGSPTGAKRPLSFFLIGLTGVGKTELGKALADVLYGSRDRIDVIPLGHISHESQFNKIFGSEPGYIGSAQERSFEEALRNNPQGGVIIWDEASNLGGASKELKEAFFKKFYDLIDEGVWVSPATGTTYYLSKFIFIFTGNDGEKLYRGVSSDELLLHVWKKNSSRKDVREILLQAGVPPAFIGRMADCLHMKPLLRNEVASIAKIHLDRELEPFRARPGLKIEFDEEFLRKFSLAFFNTDTGGRSLRTVAENRIRGFLTPLLVEFDCDSKNGETTLRLTLDYDPPNKPYRKTDDSEQKVVFRVGVQQGEVLGGERVLDLTEFADIRDLLLRKQALKTAYHEAGHAVVNDSAITGEKLGHVTIRRGKGYLGYAHYDDLRGHETLVVNREVAVARIARLLGGQMAMVMAGYPPDSGWSGDLEKARQMATKMVLDWGLAKGLTAIAVTEKGKPELTEEQRKIVAVEIEQLVEEGHNLARLRITNQWPLVRRLVSGLMREGLVTSEVFEGWQSELRGQRASQRVPKNPECSGLAELLTR